MRNIKLTIEYDGTDFEGWQVQRNARRSRTVQDEIQKVLAKLFKEKITLIGSSRTDSGVHALGQTANLKTKSTHPLAQIKKALNANLPKDITIIKVEEVPLDFHAQFSAKSKTYRYTILNRDAHGALDWRYSLWYPHKLNLKLMREEAKAFIGRKDFKSFQGAQTAKQVKNSVRTIKRIDIKKKKDYIYIDIEADGFLYKMVRNIVGTLLASGSGRLPKGSLKKILAKKDRACAGPTARPYGLTLLEVKY